MKLTDRSPVRVGAGNRFFGRGTSGTRAAPLPHQMALTSAFFWPESGRILVPRFRARNQAQIPASVNKTIGNQIHGLNSVPGIWVPKCARIPAQKFKKIGPCSVAMVPLLLPPSPIRKADSMRQPGRDFALSVSRRMQSAASTTSCGSGRAARNQSA